MTLLDDKDEFLDPAIDRRRSLQRLRYIEKKLRRCKWRQAYWNRKIRKIDARLAEINTFLKSMGSSTV